MLGFGFGLADVAGAGRFDPARLFAGGAAGAWYDPSDLSSMAQNSDGTGAAAVDGPVGRIADKSGNGNHAIQAVAAARPLLRADGGGRLYLEFDGVDDELRAAFSCPQPWDRVSAIRQTSSTGSERIFGAIAVNSQLAQANTPPALYVHDGGGFISSGGLALGVNGVVSERHAGAASRFAINSEVPITGDIGTVAVDGISLASAGTFVAGRNSNIRLYGVLMIGRALGEAEAARLRRFMAAKAGVAS